jgi:excisionase family DNA binding protein
VRAISGELSVPEAARQLGVSERTIWNWIEAQRLVVSRTAQLGKQRRVWVTTASVDEERRRREGETEGA